MLGTSQKRFSSTIAAFCDGKPPNGPKPTLLLNAVRADGPANRVPYHEPVASTDILEVEWQFAAPDIAGVASWLAEARVPGYTVTPGPTKDLHDTYFDSPDWRIHAARYTCRVRTKGTSSELTLKAMAEAQSSMRSRRELTETLERAERALAQAPERTELASPVFAPGPAGQLIRTAVGRRPVMPIFSLHTHRQTFVLADEAGTIGEIAVDETTVPVAETEPYRFSRVEVEVDADAVERAGRFVDLLVAAGGLTPAGSSKFEAALAATGQAVPGPVSLGPVEVVGTQTAAETAYAILRKQFGAFLANEAGTRLGDDIEALHDMRVASRRLRAAMSAFGQYLPPRMQPLRDQLGWVASALGVVRDLDVQIERLPEWREGFTPEQIVAVDAIEAILRGRRDAARKRMLAVLDSRRYDVFVLRFTAALRRGPPKRFGAGQEPILAVAPDLVERRYKRLDRDGGRIHRNSPPDAYHALRIESKKLRYALEFVGPIYGKAAISFSKRVTELQDVLGLHQDAYVATAMLQELAATSARKLGPNALLTMGAIAERYRQHGVELRAQFPKVFKPLTGVDWTRLLKTMESRRAPAPAPSAASRL